MASLSTQNEKHINELEQNISRMKNQQAQLQKRLQEENEEKKSLEAEIQQGQQRIKVKTLTFYLLAQQKFNRNCFFAFSRL